MDNYFATINKIEFLIENEEKSLRHRTKSKIRELLHFTIKQNKQAQMSSLLMLKLQAQWRWDLRLMRSLSIYGRLKQQLDVTLLFANYNLCILAP